MVLKYLLNSTVITLGALALVSCGGGSGGSTVPPPPPPPPPPPAADTTSPTVSFSPVTLTVESEATGTSTLTATDDTAVTTGPTVTCTNGGSFAGGIFTAPAVTLNTTSVCTATAGDAAGNSGSATLTVTITPPSDSEAPVVSFSPAILTVTSEQTGASTLTATDNVAVTTGPTVTCTNGGSFAGGIFTAPRTGLNITSVCTATAGDAAGNNGSGTLTVTVNQAPASGDVSLSGKLTFDLVPLNTTTNGLNYDAIVQAPARGITVEALSATSAIVATTVTDDAGDYSFTFSPNTNVRVRAKAEMLQTTGARWNVRVVDNTSSDALYTIVGSLTEIGTLDQTRDLTAGSGWGGSSYTGTRAAAPFAILNPIYTALKKIEAVDADVIFPPAEFNWSINNRAANGVVANGEIGTSSYVGNGEILILGDDNSDTDEYDDHVIVHEWGHYFEDQLSRSDSIGGPHSGGQKLDPRVAMGEGFGNALSGIITDDPFYRDSSGNQQGSGFAINVETNEPAGWFDEATVQSVLYDIYDNGDDGSDTLSLGLGPVYETLVSSDYRAQPDFTTIFSFLAELRMQQAASVTAINSLAVSRGINSTAANGAGETNSGAVARSLPVYKPVAVNGAAVEICSNNDQGLYNKLGNRAYLSFTAIAGAHTLRMTRRSGAASRDPDFIIYKNGSVAGRAEAAPSESESLTLALTAGEHVVDAYDFFNLGQGGSGVAGDACYNFTITR